MQTIRQQATQLAKDDLANKIITRNELPRSIENYIRWLEREQSNKIHHQSKE